MADKQLSGPSQGNSDQIVPVLQDYLREAQDARRGGMNPRDDKWEQNLNLYWGRYDMSRKAAWQAQEVMPEVSKFVDRFAAALKDALVASPSGFYTVVDPSDAEGDLTNAIKRMNDVWLSTSGKSYTGTPLDFPAVFEEQIKLGALMNCCSSVGWKNDSQWGRVQIDTVDPRQVWLDATGRNLYRIRRIEIDKHELRDMAGKTDKKGRAIYNTEAIDQMVTHIEEEGRRQREDLTGHGQQTSSNRQPVVLDEYLATVVGPDGHLLAKDSLMVVGNNKFLVRGPEPNPFWHKRDWVVTAPLVIAPLSVYGRTYMEDFGHVAGTFNRLTNLILDSVQMSSLKAFAMVPSMLMNPEQAAEGLSANKLFLLEEGTDVRAFWQALELGNLKPESFQVWQSIKNELREAADINEIGLGQFAPKGRTSATEVTGAMESSNALIRSIAQTIEGRWLNPTLDLVWKTGLQHVKPNDPMIKAACGEELFGALMKRRKELLNRQITFQARGISTLIQKSKMLRALLQVMQYLAQSPQLLGAFMQTVDLNKFVKLLFDLSDVDLHKVTISDRDRMLKGVTDQLMQAQANAQGQGGPPPQEGDLQEGAQLAQMLGVQR